MFLGFGRWGQQQLGEDRAWKKWAEFMRVLDLEGWGKLRQAIVLTLGLAPHFSLSHPHSRYVAQNKVHGLQSLVEHSTNPVPSLSSWVSLGKSLLSFSFLICKVEL